MLGSQCRVEVSMPVKKKCVGEILCGRIFSGNVWEGKSPVGEILCGKSRGLVVVVVV